MNSLPRLRPGMKVWRPVILHGTHGLQPLSIPVISGTELVGEIWKPIPAEFKSVWGDNDNIGALPYDRGWRVSLDSDVGVITTCSNVPPCWTHFVINRLRRHQRNGKYVTIAIAECFDDGHNELYRILRKLRDTEPDLAGTPLDLFDREVYYQNWGRTQAKAN